jgi:hypothetical protein
MRLNTIKDYFLLIVDLYQKSSSNEDFIETFNRNYRDIEFTFNNNDKMIIEKLNDLKLLFKFKYCIELPKLHIFTPYENAHLIAGDISKRILLGTFRRRTLTKRQKEMFEKSISVNLDNLEMFDLSIVSELSFIKDENIEIY